VVNRRAWQPRFIEDLMLVGKKLGNFMYSHILMEPKLLEELIGDLKRESLSQFILRYSHKFFDNEEYLEGANKIWMKQAPNRVKAFL